ncbi:9371_t:CDS:2, partial [Racocetra fulgida]
GHGVELCKKKGNEEIEKQIKEYLTTPFYSVFEPICLNTTLQKQAFNTIKILQKELEELNTMTTITTNIQLHNDLSSQKSVVQKEIREEEERLRKLKRHAHNQQKSEMKKL